MNLSKAWGDDPDQDLAGKDPEFNRRVVRTVVVLLGTVALALAAWAGWSMLSTGEPLLQQSRQLLRQSLAQPADSIERMHRTESLLREYLQRNGRHEDSARLLLCASLTLRGVYDPDRRISQAQAIEESLNSVLPTKCSLDDLSMAIDVFIHSGRLAQADWLLGAALQIGQGTPDYERLLRLAVDLRYDLGREKEVLEHCAELVEMHPDDPEPWRRMAMVYEDGGYDERVIESLERVVELDARGANEDRLKLVNTLITIGQRGPARRHFDLLAARSPELVARHRLTEAKLLMLEGETARATEIVEQILADDPKATDAMLFSGQLMLSQNRALEAMEIIQRLLELDPMNFQAHYVLGQICARQGQRERAEQHLAMHRKILDTRVQIHTLERRAGRNPNDSEARSELIRLYELLGMTDHAQFWRRAAATSGYEG
ncbi:MAG: tetratricopeptide repeat protein [Pirellulaceae bacterium]|nr:tetratricopeptide repeat protein [Pirellulaceae bacterium]